MAKASGMSQTALVRIWRAFGLQPHRAETFKPSTDPLFVEKVRDIVGLYLNPPQRVLGLWCGTCHPRLPTHQQSRSEAEGFVPSRSGQ
jgi:hypothetical protein